MTVSSRDPLGARLILLIYWPVLMISTHWPGLDLQVAGHDFGKLYLDKPIHLLAFGLLEGLLFAAKPLGRSVGLRLNLVASVLLASSYGYMDEYTQILFDRSFSITDLLCNVVGILAVMWLMAARVRDRQTQICDNVLLARLMLVMLVPLGLLLTLTPGLSLDVPLGLPMGPQFADRIEMRGDHLLHLLGALGAVWLLASAALLGRARPRAGIVFAVLTLGLFGPALEWIQFRIGRGFEWGDIIANELGVWLAIVTGAGYLLAIRRTRATTTWETSDSPSETTLSRTQVQHQPSEAVPKTETAFASNISSKVASAPPSQSRAWSTGSFVHHARTVAGLTLLSRLTGLVRDSVLAATLGMGHLADAFHMGFLIPHLFRRLFGEGALSAAFIPRYSRLLKEDPLVARRLVWACVGLLFLGLGIIVLLGEWILASMLHMGYGSAPTQVALRLMMLMLPYMPLVCAVALLGGMLQVHGRFGPPAAAPILLNLCMIGAAAVVLRWYDPMRGVYLIGLAVLIAGGLQLIWQIRVILRYQPLTLSWTGTGPPLRDIGKIMLPMLLGLAVFQINAAMDTLISYSLSPKNHEAVLAVIAGKQLFYPIRVGAVAALNWAQRLYQFPLGVFGIAIATAVFPALSRVARTNQKDFQTIVHHGLRLTVFIALPASVGLILVRLPLVRLIYQYGRFDLHDAQRVAVILVGYALAIWAYSMTHVLTRAFYALSDAKTPLKLTVVNVLLNLSLNLILIWYMGVAGLAWSTAISAIWQTFLLLRAMRRHIAMPIDDVVLRSWGRSLLLSLMMGMVLLPILNQVEVASLSRIDSAWLLGLLVLTGAGVYLGGARLMGSPELAWLLKLRRADDAASD